MTAASQRRVQAAFPIRKAALFSLCDWCYNDGVTALDFPVFDADNHLYETEDAFTRHLPAAHRNLFRFVELGGRKKLVVRNELTEFIPNPTFEVVAPPGAHMAFYGGNNPE